MNTAIKCGQWNLLITSELVENVSSVLIRGSHDQIMTVEFDIKIPHL